ncbi:MULTISPECIES: isochorismatase family protein [Komagataeibacter]|uniref:Isochorismatase family protein YecD n=2 Tax=Komagataeibacter saccharivorans TaxID=265959 RepID=A0A347WF03_9PROT|nr:isochorismatase family protein [Komagataeibacter saccharivorans]AXY23446.1 Isochorismatase family protein YecD [Komagataeibacter saccharivorans]PYD50267.1 hydrolase [Komagataeibacter saccharivorans]QBL92657.1 Isochorismatase family protein YecD [Komagataeibacter saccharivorans]GBQ39830.1 isochorismatase hydrolase [Komagataeibacter saccharivorans NRIC 0614]
MTITTLDPKTALIVIDMQKGIVDLPLVHPIKPIIERTQDLLNTFRARGLPVVLARVVGTAPGRTESPRFDPDGVPDDFADLIPALNQQSSDIVCAKRSWGAFATTDLESRLKGMGVTQVVVIGVATATGVEATARQAYEAGFNVTLASDVMTDIREEAHDYSLKHVFPRLGEVGTTSDIIGMMGREKRGQ